MMSMNFWLSNVNNSNVEIRFYYFFQELDYVYHDVSAVMTESLMQGADMIAMKVRKTLNQSNKLRVDHLILR